MGSGNSGLSGKSPLSAQAKDNVKDINGYHVTRSDGVELDFFFTKQDGETYVSNSLGSIPEPTPNGWTETEMIDTIKRFGGDVSSYSQKDLVNMETERLKDREQTNAFLDQTYARNRGADITNKGYRNSRRAQRMSRRNS